MQFIERDLIAPHISDRDLAFLERDPGNMVNPDRVSLALQSDTARRYEQSFGIFDPPELPEIVPIRPAGVFYDAGMVVELARAVVPSGVLGALVRIDTAVIDATTGSAGAWDTPPLWPVLFDFHLILNSIFDRSVRDQRIRTIPGAIIPVASFFSACGGVPFIPLSLWSDNRYQWNNRSNEVIFPIPAGSFLSLFARSRSRILQPHKLQARLSWLQQAETGLSSTWRHARP